MEITVRDDQLNKLAEAVQKAGRKLPVELAAACNTTARRMKTPISKRIRTVLATKAAAVNKVISQSRKATKKDIQSAVQVKATARIPLKEFGARHTRKGVTYKISKKGGRKTIPDAFMGPKPGAMAPKLHGHVFRRKGGERLPIKKLFGASPWGVFVKNDMEEPTAQNAEFVLTKELNRRIQFNVFKASELT